MRNAGVILTVTNTLMAEIAQDWSTPTGQQLITLLFADVFPRQAPASPELGSGGAGLWPVPLCVRTTRLGRRT
jgi:hypothetical protein